jgi:hypothetical protein
MPIQEFSCSAGHRTDFYLDPADYENKNLERFCPLCGQSLSRSVRIPKSPLYQPGGAKFVMPPSKSA